MNVATAARHNTGPHVDVQLFFSTRLSLKYAFADWWARNAALLEQVSGILMVSPQHVKRRSQYKGQRAAVRSACDINIDRASILGLFAIVCASTYKQNTKTCIQTGFLNLIRGLLLPVLGESDLNISTAANGPQISVRGCLVNVGQLTAVLQSVGLRRRYDSQVLLLHVVPVEAGRLFLKLLTFKVWGLGGHGFFHSTLARIHVCGGSCCSVFY